MGPTKSNKISDSLGVRHYYYYSPDKDQLYNVTSLQFGGLRKFFGSFEENADLEKLILLYQSVFNADYILPPPKEIINLSTLNLSELDLTLQKNLFKVELVYNKFGSKYNHIFSTYRQVLPTLKHKLALDALLLYISPSWHENQLLDYLKNFGTFLMYQVTSNSAPISIIPFIEMHILSGYDTYHHRSFDIIEDTKPFSTPRSFPAAYRDVYKRFIRDTIDEIQIYQFPNCMFEDFVKYRDNWNLMGSATIGLPMRIQTQGFRKPTRISSKFTNLLYYDDNTLLEKLHEYTPHIARPFLKTDEAAKARVVIGYDTRSYIRCSYFEKFIKSLNGNTTWTTVGMDPNSLDDVRSVVDNNTHTHKYTMVCTDQSAFDQHQYREMFIYAFDYLCSRIAQLNPQIWPIYHIERYGLSHAKIIYPDGSERPWLNGLLSGHKFTALIGSVLNRTSSLVAAHLSEMSVDWAVFQGDDALMFTSTPDKINDFLLAYSKLGMEVNPAKTWRGTDRTEYLHQIYIPNACISLPARAALNLIFRDPKTVDVSPDQYYQSQLDAFRMCQRRGLDVYSGLNSYVRVFLNKYYKQDINISHRYGKLKFRRNVFNYLHTPTLFGGGGFTPYVPRDLYTLLVFTKSRDSKYEDVESHIISPYHYRIPGAPLLTEKWILTKIYQHLPEPHLQTRCYLQKFRFNNRTKLPARVFPRSDFNYNPRQIDNTDNWRKHCKSLLNLACVFGMIHLQRFQKYRSKVSTSFNLQSDLTNDHLSRFQSQCWDIFYNRVMALYVCTRMKLSKVEDLIYTYRHLRLKELIENSAQNTNYGYYY